MMAAAAQSPSQAPAALSLRDIHQPPAPSWWPPAPGWWLVGLLVASALAVLAVSAVGRLRRRRRARARLAFFDQAVAAAGTPVAQLAAASELLRRAARHRDPGADRLEGGAWLEFLDAGQGTAFSEGAGKILLEAPYRRDVDPAQAQAVIALARARYRQWTEGA